MLNGGGGYDVTHGVVGGEWVRCASLRQDSPLACIFPVPARKQGRKRRAREEDGGGGGCVAIPRVGLEPAELGEGKQGPRPLPSPRGRAPALWPLPVHFHSPSASPRRTPPRAQNGAVERPPFCNPGDRAAQPSHSPVKGIPRLSKKKKKKKPTVSSFVQRFQTPETSMLPPRAAPACIQPRGEGPRGWRWWSPHPHSQVLRLDWLHVSLAWGHVHQLSLWFGARSCCVSTK